MDWHHEEGRGLDLHHKEERGLGLYHEEGRYLHHEEGGGGGDVRKRMMHYLKKKNLWRGKGPLKKYFLDMALIFELIFQKYNVRWV